MNAEQQARLEERLRAWSVAVERVFETGTSVVAVGQRVRQPVVVKIVKNRSEEWLSGQILAAFDGHAVVRAIEHAGGAVLLERVVPGDSLASRRDIDDQRATAILAKVIGGMRPGAPPRGAPAVEAWAAGFDSFLSGVANDPSRITTEMPVSLVERARTVYLELCGTQSTRRLLHGDLHHENVLFDERRGWLAIDPKGLIGELACEVGAALRNPCDRPGLFASPATIERRVAHFATVLRLDRERILKWTFAQAVLAAIWEVEDTGDLHVGAGWLTLARNISDMFGRALQ